MTGLDVANLSQDVAAWSLVEFGQTDLGDPRRTERLLQLASALASNPTCSLPAACKSWADTKGAYRFLDNDEIDPESILSGHRQSTLQRMSEHRLVLSIQDTTTYSFTTRRATRGLGPIGGRFPGSDDFPMGFLVHSALAVTPDGVPLGLLGHKLWTRPRVDTPEQTPELEAGTSRTKESICWEEVLTKCIQGIPQGTKLLTVCDRGADIYDFFVAARRLKQDVLVRSAHNRELAGRKDHLWDRVERSAPIGVMLVDLPRADERQPQTVTLQLQSARVRLHIPFNASARITEIPRMVLNAILVKEIDAPVGREPIEWRLLTTMPVESAEDACNCVRWYTKRWTIERYHYTLKSGCQVEELQLETIERLHRALAVYSVVAWRLLYLTYAARTEPDSPCSWFLTTSEWQALYCHTHRTKTPPANPPSLQTAILWIAKLGGFLARKRDGHPGVKVLWQGYRRLQDMVIMWDLLRAPD